MIVKGLLEQEITKDIIEYTIYCASYLTKPDSNVASAIINKLYSLIYDAKLYVRIFEDLDVEDKKALLKTLDKYYKEIETLKDTRSFSIAAVDSIFWELTNYLNAKTKEDFEKILTIKNETKS
jgi:viroplasmin and RNaseH domain-containing protein